MIGGDEVKAFRRIHDISQSELARRIGIVTSAVSRWEQGLSRPGMESRRALRALEAELGGDIQVFSMPGKN